jgi:hypothetical protein
MINDWKKTWRYINEDLSHSVQESVRTKMDEVSEKFIILHNDELRGL